ncbi:hypothetical protein [Ewingella americana]|uniref:hypothetical protein n=1 Tax=Ewingella americana TaxID=41202 RepID=UPI00163A6149|nr:hypothetical protein [Ewingella americana]QMV51526.1 hypothetical protein GXP68_09305 [Ewingella americana]
MTQDKPTEKQEDVITAINVAMMLISNETSLDSIRHNNFFDRINIISPKQEGRPEITTLTKTGILTITGSRDINSNEWNTVSVVLKEKSWDMLGTKTCNFLTSLNLRFLGSKKEVKHITSINVNKELTYYAFHYQWGSNDDIDVVFRAESDEKYNVNNCPQNFHSVVVSKKTYSARDKL